ncbi:MAG: hypothetical protein QM791_14440 [Ferruginibacter sp.]
MIYRLKHIITVFFLSIFLLQGLVTVIPGLLKSSINKEDTELIAAEKEGSKETSEETSFEKSEKVYFNYFTDYDNYSIIHSKGLKLIVAGYIKELTAFIPISTPPPEFA